VFVAFPAVASLDAGLLKGVPEWTVMSGPLGPLGLSRANSGEPVLWNREGLRFAWHLEKTTRSYATMFVGLEAVEECFSLRSVGFYCCS
jgi:hypothetical protein